MTAPHEYPICHLVFLPSDGQESQLKQHEWMGTKPKYWVSMISFGDSHFEDWLLKRGRPGTGEHWAEKIAYEVGLLLGLAIAEIQLAQWDGWNGEVVTISKSFKRPGQSIIHGNELLSWVNPNYPREGESYQTKGHTLLAVRDALCSHGVLVDPGFQRAGVDAFGVFVGYLLLDALVCNTDRHHENWAVIADGTGEDRRLTLAPTYDHASSLGRELQDVKRLMRLGTQDPKRSVRAYCDKASSALFEHEGAAKQLSCFAAYQAACELDPLAAKYWQQVVNRLQLASLVAIVESVPDGLMTTTAKQFAVGMLTDRLNLLKDSHQ